MSTKEIILEQGIKWSAASLYETKRGKIKQIATGVPGPLFWKHYKESLASRMKDAGLSLNRLAKGQWEVVCWIRDANRCFIEETGLTIPALPEVSNESTPF
jgi:hypothetical protein